MADIADRFDLNASMALSAFGDEVPDGIEDILPTITITNHDTWGETVHVGIHPVYGSVWRTETTPWRGGYHWCAPMLPQKSWCDLANSRGVRRSGEDPQEAP